MITAKSLNSVTLLGNVVRVETQKVNDNTLTRFTLATEEGYFSKEKNHYVSQPAFHSVKAWRWLGEKFSNLETGDQVVLEGRLKSESYPDKKFPEVVRKHVYIEATQGAILKRKNAEDNPDKDAQTEGPALDNNDDPGNDPF